MNFLEILISVIVILIIVLVITVCIDAFYEILSGNNFEYHIEHECSDKYGIGIFFIYDKVIREMTETEYAKWCLNE